MKSNKQNPTLHPPANQGGKGGGYDCQESGEVGLWGISDIWER